MLHDVSLESPPSTAAPVAPAEPSDGARFWAAWRLAAACAAGTVTVVWTVLLCVFLANADDLKDGSPPCRAHEVWVWCLVTVVLVGANLVLGSRLARAAGGGRILGSVIGGLAHLGFVVYGTVVWAAIETRDHAGASCLDYYDDDRDHRNLLAIFILTIAFYWGSLLALALYTWWMTWMWMAGREF